MCVCVWGGGGVNPNPNSYCTWIDWGVGGGGWGGGNRHLMLASVVKT